MRRYGCRSCGAAGHAPLQHAVVCSLASHLYELLLHHLPDQALHDAELATIVDLDWRLESPWTSGVINFDSPLPYHRDANNLPTWSAMLTWRYHTGGGNLHIPDYDVVLPCRDADVLYFPGHRLGHAVTPLHRRHDGYRHTAVYYTVSQMRHCPPITEHVSYAQRERTDAEDHWRQRQLAAGLLEP